MPVITLETRIEAPIEHCFDLSRDIELHMRSTQATREIAIGGVTKGLINLGEDVTWEATHFGIRQRLTSRITAVERPNHFRDSQVRGAFRRFDHDHYFEMTSSGGTLMRDLFDYTSPLFYLVNIGYVTLALKSAGTLSDLRESIELVSEKLGNVLVVVGLMHFGNLFVFSRMRNHGKRSTTPPPPSRA